MKYNAVLDVQKSGGGTLIGNSAGLQSLTLTATLGQTAFVFPNSTTILLFFVDGIKYDKVTTLTGNKDFTFSGGTVSILTGTDAGVKVSALYAGASSDLTSQPEPVTLTEVKDFLRIDVADDDTLLSDILIPAAREICEAYTNISFITRTVTAQLLNQLGSIYLPYGPVSSMVSIIDEDGLAILSTDYELKGVLFKQLKTPFPYQVTLSYTAGYAVVPKNLKAALLNQIAHLYNNRGDNSISMEARTILNQERR